MDQPLITDSARRHGVGDETILDDGMTMFIGPDHAGNPYEIGVANSSEGPVVAHAMPARAKYLR